MRTEKATFPGAHGDELAARLDLPDGTPVACAIIAHCFTCSKDVFAASRVAAALTELGMAVLRFDFTGLGHSDGEFENTTFSSNVGDLVAAADFLRARLEGPSLLVGHSLGGTAVLAAAGRIPEVKAVATINAPSDPAHVQHLFVGQLPAIEAEGEAEVQIGGRHFRVRREMLRDLEEQQVLEQVAGLKRALLVFHAPFDRVVGVDNARRIFDAAKHPKSFISLDTADHLLTDHADGIYVAHVIAAWASRYLGVHAAQPTPADGEEVAPDRIRVEESSAGRLAQRIRAGRHTLQADEPERLGGNDTGPTPYDLLLAGLGSCTAMTLRLYAERKGWPLERVAVELKHEKVHAEDCATCETQTGRIDRIERTLEIQGPLDEEQRKRLLEIADRCPVHRTLESEVVVVTSEKAR
ncbi:alpha/beta fold hydrolase [Vulgatibacter sp.]|uniref:bifunctional alpha/beta hydrolase/OsmC family protein n=1 Tax=Vulgatibacter sp. TaxID=1971226 RepID=UPI003568996A